MLSHEGKATLPLTKMASGDKKNKTCKFLLENKDELHRDYGRYSVNGPKYLGKLIYNKIVNLDD